MYKSFLVFLCIIGGYGILPYPRRLPLCYPYAAFLSAILMPSCFSVSVVGGCVGIAGWHTLL